MPYKNKNSPTSIEAARIARRKHYQNNKEQYYRNNILKKNRMIEYINDVKNVPCMDCGVKYPPFVMDFDHRDQESKANNVSILTKKGSWTKLKNEVSKCDIVCANCHRIRSAKMMNWHGRQRKPV